MRSRANRARPSIRRVVLHWRVDHTDLLPPHVSGEARQVAQRRLLPHRGCRRARGIPPLLAVSTRDRTGDAGVARCCGDSYTRTAAHRARIPGRWQARRGSRRYAWDDNPTSAPTVRAARRSVADRGRNDPARSARETAGGRDHDADVLDRVRCGVCERPAIQRRVSRRVSTAANGRSQNKPWARERSERCHCVGSSRRSLGSASVERRPAAYPGSLFTLSWTPTRRTCAIHAPALQHSCLGCRSHWPIFRCPRLAGFQTSTEATRSFGSKSIRSIETISSGSPLQQWI